MCSEANPEHVSPEVQVLLLEGSFIFFFQELICKIRGAAFTVSSEGALYTWAVNRKAAGCEVLQAAHLSCCTCVLKTRCITSELDVMMFCCTA